MLVMLYPSIMLSKSLPNRLLSYTFRSIVFSRIRLARLLSLALVHVSKPRMYEFIWLVCSLKLRSFGDLTLLFLCWLFWGSPLNRMTSSSCARAAAALLLLDPRHHVDAQLASSLFKRRSLRRISRCFRI